MSNIALLSNLIPYFNIRNLYISKDLAMPEAKITSKGQVTIPIQVRRDLRLDVGDILEFVKISDGRYEVIAANARISDIKGIFEKPRKKVTLDEMRESVIKKAASKR
jgi:AbrB family looped-hinge helix DNA binding protein